MIVAAGEKSIGSGKIVIVGLTEADIEEMRQGLSKTKEGNAAYGFSSLVVFMGKTDQEMIEVLSQVGTIRSDDIFPNIGSG